MLKSHKIDAFISAGNTGALMAGAKILLPMLEGIERPALLTLLPTKNKPVAVLDVGANVACKPHHLVQFAKMGLAYQKSRGIVCPTVGLLNIGSEKEKGTENVKEAYEALLELNGKETIFLGNIEGREVFEGKVDVLATDGFTGNIFLKTAEGIAAFILDRLNDAVLSSAAPELKVAVNHLEQLLHYAEYPGAILCGVDGIVVKCHGHSNEHAFINGIKGAIRLVEHKFLEKIKKQLSINHEDLRE
jgi:glycerol-3-phosphate acyltransferase PlsX